MLRIEDDATGSEEDERVTLRLALVSPMEFSSLIEINVPSEHLTNELIIVITDDDRTCKYKLCSAYIHVGASCTCTCTYSVVLGTCTTVKGVRTLR